MHRPKISLGVGKEVEAESVAYMICQYYSIKTSDYSFSYDVGWSEGKELERLKVSFDTIRRAVSEMISDIEERLEVLVTEQTKAAEDEMLARKKETVECLWELKKGVTILLYYCYNEKSVEK